jgi:hypothetical protein
MNEKNSQIDEICKDIDLLGETAKIIEEDR